MKYGLTPKQKRMLDFVSGYIAHNGYSPSYPEIAVGLGMSAKSKSAVHYMLKQLEARGHIVFPADRRARGLTLSREAA